MTVTVISLRESFPEFADATKYTDPMVQVWLTAATQLVNAGRWGDMTDMGIMLLTAHHLVLARRNVRAAAGTPGLVVGIQTSKSVDGVSVSYDVGSATEDGAGHYNMTSYGLQFVHFARMFGAGPVHIGADALTSIGQAWPGPAAVFF
mgnify:CR=1 FL=1